MHEVGDEMGAECPDGRTKSDGAPVFVMVREVADIATQMVDGRAAVHADRTPGPISGERFVAVGT